MELRPDREAKAWLRSRTLGAPLASARHAPGCRGVKQVVAHGNGCCAPTCCASSRVGSRTSASGPSGRVSAPCPLLASSCRMGAGGGGHWLSVGCEPFCGLRTSTCNLRLSRERPKTLARKPARSLPLQNHHNNAPRRRAAGRPASCRSRAQPAPPRPCPPAPAASTWGAGEGRGWVGLR